MENWGRVGTGRVTGRVIEKHTSFTEEHRHLPVITPHTLELSPLSSWCGTVEPALEWVVRRALSLVCDFKRSSDPQRWLRGSENCTCRSEVSVKNPRGIGKLDASTLPAQHLLKTEKWVLKAEEVDLILFMGQWG